MDAMCYSQNNFLVCENNFVKPLLLHQFSHLISMELSSCSMEAYYASVIWYVTTPGVLFLGKKRMWW